MSILIKGMEMPRLGYREIRIHPDGRITENDEGYEETIGTAIPVPPHGRLIDADALIKSLSLDESDAENGASLLMAIFLEVLKTAPAIIEAEEGE